ncbi:MAG: SIS domain-containing protein [Streptosporangiaceae bacterium]
MVLSQSGATPEIIEACGRMRAGGARTVAITNEPASPLAASAEVVLGLGAGRERAVPATKTVTAELLTVTAVAAALGPLPFARSDLDVLPGVVRQTVEDDAPARRLAAPWAGSALPFPAGLGDQLSAFPALVRGRQLALASAKVRGADPDTPRGLTKVTPTH